MNDFLKQQFSKYPDTKLWFSNKKTKEHWVSWKKFSECTEQEIKQANLREIFKNEIILDIDKKEQLEEIKQELTFENYNFSIWETGSRGYHIQLIFDNLELLDEQHRKAIRSIFSTKYKTDKTKDNESTLIALENRQHFKTGNTIKNLLQENYINNIISSEIIDQTKTIKYEIYENDTFIIDEEYQNFHIKDQFFNFIKTNIFSESQERNNIIFKNTTSHRTIFKHFF